MWKELNFRDFGWNNIIKKQLILLNEVSDSYLYIVLWTNWVVPKIICTPLPLKIPLRILSKISEDSNMILTKDFSKILSKILLKILYDPT